MRRRQFIAFLGGAAVAWPIAARAQQAAMPVIGFLSGVPVRAYAFEFDAFRAGLNHEGFVEGKDVSIELRSADDDYARLPALAAEFVNRRVDVIVAGAGGLPSALAAKAATTTIPIVFSVGLDPVKAGLVESLNRPGGNITGVVNLTSHLGSKAFGLLRELVPKTTTIAVLVNPNNPNSELQIANMLDAVGANGPHVLALKAGTAGEIDAAFATLAQHRNAALVVSIDSVFMDQRDQIIALAAGHAVPAIYARRAFVTSGGLMSYGTDATEGYRQVGIYAGRILKGANPATLPVVQSTKFELVINLKTAKALGIEVPTSIQLLADEVIE